MGHDVLQIAHGPVVLQQPVPRRLVVTGQEGDGAEVAMLELVALDKLDEVRAGAEIGANDRVAAGEHQHPDRKSTRLTPVTNAHLLCRLLLEKKNMITCIPHHATRYHPPEITS